MSAAPPIVSVQRSQRESYREGSLCHKQTLASLRSGKWQTHSKIQFQ
jgi:hypothetical protein